MCRITVDERHTPDTVQEAAGTLAMSVVHDLRNPLAAIHSGAEILSASRLPDEQVRRVARNVFNASVRIQELLQDYVDLCRTGDSRPHPSNLGSLVAHAVDRVASLAETQSVAVIQKIPADLVVILNRRRIASVLNNLLVNALDAMRTGGLIDISAVVTEASVVVRVLDTGPGVAADIRDRLFQPFVTAGKPNGWGMGLTHARQIITGHGGEIWLESPPGWGACFAFSLPLYHGAQRAG